jgi:hypothetical protein
VVRVREQCSATDAARLAAALLAQQRGELCHMAALSLVMAAEAKPVLGSGEQILFVICATHSCGMLRRG